MHFETHFITPDYQKSKGNASIVSSQHSSMMVPVFGPLYPEPATTRHHDLVGIVKDPRLWPWFFLDLGEATRKRSRHHQNNAESKWIPLNHPTPHLTKMMTVWFASGMSDSLSLGCWYVNFRPPSASCLTKSTGFSWLNYWRLSHRTHQTNTNKQTNKKTNN